MLLTKYFIMILLKRRYESMLHTCVTELAFKRTVSSPAAGATKVVFFLGR